VNFSLKLFFQAHTRQCGAVRLGAHSKVGANAVVLQDVPEGATRIGIPGRVIG